MDFEFLFFAIGIILECAIHCFCTATDGTKCLKDSSISEIYEENVYYCQDPQPTCCHRDDEPTCCEDSSQKSVKNQFELWGILGVLVVGVAFGLICWKKDTYMCEGETMKERCSRCCRCRSKRKQNSKDDSTVELTVLEGDSGDRKLSAPAREGTTVTSRGVEPIFTSDNDFHAPSDVDSGRGSVSSTSSPSNLLGNKSNTNISKDENSMYGKGELSSDGKNKEHDSADNKMNDLHRSEVKKGKMKDCKSRSAGKKLLSSRSTTLEEQNLNEASSSV